MTVDDPRDVKPVVSRSAATRDVDEAIGHHLEVASDRVVLRFIDALEHAFAPLGRQPASGSPRFAQELRIPGLRTWPLDRFPYLVFYIEREDHVDVWRVLHGRRDIPSWLRDPPR